MDVPLPVRLMSVGAAAVLVLLVVVAAVTPPRTEAFPGGDFYTPPGRFVAGRHGTLLRYERARPSALRGATTWRVMYRSTSVAGDDIAVTGLVVVPDAPAPTDGRRVLTIGHGTAGIADRCAPSKAPDTGDVQLLGEAVRQGWLVVVTDYEGLGTPGRHPYLVGPSEGRAMLDGVRAAAAVPDARPGRRIAIAGYSQGGHAALWAHQVAARWTPELQVVGTFSGAPVSELPRYLADPSRGATAGFTHLLAAGLAAAYPDLDLDALLTPEGMASLPIVDQACGVAVLGNYQDSNPAELVRRRVGAEAPWATRARANVPGATSAADPVLLLHARADEWIPVTDSDALLARLCGAGQVVERRLLGDGLGHGQAQAPAYALGLAWLTARFDGRGGVTDTCRR